MAQGRLTGSVAIVTGASEGIAEAIAKMFAREGAAVAVVSRNLERTQRIAGEIERDGGCALALAADVRRAPEVQRMVQAVIERWSKVDILVNGVGGYTGKAGIEDIAEEQWDAVIELNVKTAFLCAQAVAGPMKAQRRGRIINIGSQAAIAPNPHGDSYLPYAAAKAGLIGFTKHLAKQLGPFGITVNAISPSTTLTPRARGNVDDAAVERMKAHNPMRSLVEPSDSAEAALFLASEGGRYITGMNLNVNAGTLIL
jgi:3-oxoacyl-[acyl-carrier protein] reductase